MWSPSGAPVPVALLQNLKTLTALHNPQFAGYAQQDAQEFLAFLLDSLNEDLNRVKIKPYVEHPSISFREEKEITHEIEIDLANRAWCIYKLRNDSIIVDLFHGQLRSLLVCPQCGEKNLVFDPFLFLSLPLPTQWERTLDVILIRRGRVL